MKRSLVLFAVVSCLGASQTLADDKPQRPGAEAFRTQILQQFDADKDGRLNDQERAKAKAEFARRRGQQPAARPKTDLARNRMREIMARFDKDGDGQLSPDEKAAARKAMSGNFAAQRQAMMKRFDKDGDGKLNDEERAAARKAMAGQAGGGRPGLDRKALMQKFDQNGDGSLDESERAALRKHLEGMRGKDRPARPARPAAAAKDDRPRVNREALKKFDADGDGELSPEERKAAFRALRE